MYETDINKRITCLKQFVTGKRFEILKKILDNRTRHLTVVLEDVYHPHNASAVLRSCDCFGVQDVHVIENRNALNISDKVTRGAESWLTIEKYTKPDNRNTERCIATLRKEGYRIVALTPHSPDFQLRDLEIDDKLALLFGSEKDGLSKVALQQADHKVMIPLYGFTESFNISVSVALALYDLRLKLDASNIPWQLNEGEKQTLLHQWLRNSVRAGKVIEKRFFDAG